MALIHYLCIGHFVPDDGFVRYEQMRPVCDRPLDLAALSDLLGRYLGSGSLDAIPAEWRMSVTPEYILCDRYGACSRALRFVAEYARREQATIVDLGSFTLVSPDDVTAEANHLSKREDDHSLQPPAR
jgi:hypothetical protein